MFLSIESSKHQRIKALRFKRTAININYCVTMNLRSQSAFLLGDLRTTDPIKVNHFVDG